MWEWLKNKGEEYMPTSEEMISIFSIERTGKKVYSTYKKGNREIRLISSENDNGESGWLVGEWVNGSYQEGTMSQFHTDAKEVLAEAYQRAIEL
jgi:hypothetical protein